SGQSATPAPHAVAVRALSDATRVPAVIWLDAPSGATSEIVAMTWVSAAVELIQMVASMGPERAYGAVNGGVVKVVASSSLGRLSVPQVAVPDSTPAVPRVAEREQ